jgi:hypothetical protein
MIDTAEIRAAAAVKIGTISLGSAKNLVDAFMGPDQVPQAGKIAAGVLGRESPNLELRDEKWKPLNLVTRKPVCIPDYDTLRFCVADTQVYDLAEKVC